MLSRSSIQTSAPPRLATWLLPAALMLSGCGDPVAGAAICILPSDDRIVVRASVACASDHEGATLSCKITAEGEEIEVTVSGSEGTDPDDACAPDLVATCESEPLADGNYVVTFEGEEHAASIPNDASPCDDATAD